MKTKKKKYLPLYEKWIKSGKLDDSENPTYYNGMCNFFDGDECFELFIPNEEERGDLNAYWGSLTTEADYDSKTWMRHDIESNFTTFRQTIILFMCALNEEL